MKFEAQIKGYMVTPVDALTDSLTGIFANIPQKFANLKRMSQSTIIEFVGAAMTFLNVIYAIKERWISWVWAILSAAFYCFIYWDAGLVVSAEIQVLYFIISLYGLSRWWTKSATQQPKELVWMEGGQLDFYHKSELVNPTMNKAADYFKKYL